MSFSKAVDLLNLARMATGYVGVSLVEIEAEFDCVRRTAQRMTDALVRTFPDTEDYFDTDGIKRWRVPRRKVAEFFAPDAEQIATLDMASDLLAKQGLRREENQLRSLRSTLNILTSDRARTRVEADSEALLVAMGHAARPGPRPASDARVDEQIALALKGPFQLSILYRSRTDNEAKWRQVSPYGLLLGERRYLIAQDTARDDDRLRHYRVEDIQNAKVTEAWFAIPEDFDLDAYSRRAFGVFQDEREFSEIVWKFTPEAAQHAARFLFHPDQRTHIEDDGSLIVRFSACGHLEMCWHLYAWGDQAQVLAPQALADLVANNRRSDFPSLP